MTYPEYYYQREEADKENGVVMDDDFALSEHLRFSAHSYRKSIDENSAAIKKYRNYRYSEDSNGNRSSGSGTNHSDRSNNRDESRSDHTDPSHREGSRIHLSERSNRDGSRSNHSDRSYRDGSQSNHSDRSDPEGSRSNHSYSKSGRSYSEHVNSIMQEAERSTSTKDSRRYSTSISKHDTVKTEVSNAEACEKTIALFGVSGVTGNYFLQLAVEAGYHVRALILPGFELEDMKGNPSLTLVQGTMDDQAKIHRVIRKAAYVVCMLNDCPQMIDTTPATIVPTHSNYQFIQLLVPLMSRCATCKVLLYQATSFARDTKGPAPVLTNMVKKMAVRKTRREMLVEQDKIVKFISKYQKAKSSEDGGNPFDYIITRPSELVWDRPSKKKLEASKSLPGPFPITNVDLAEFSLNALKSEKLYNTCPYVVQDGI